MARMALCAALACLLALASGAAARPVARVGDGGDAAAPAPWFCHDLEVWEHDGGTPWRCGRSRERGVVANAKRARCPANARGALAQAPASLLSCPRLQQCPKYKVTDNMSDIGIERRRYPAGADAAEARGWRRRMHRTQAT
jgi:hypothetical protein